MLQDKPFLQILSCFLIVFVEAQYLLSDLQTSIVQTLYKIGRVGKLE